MIGNKRTELLRRAALEDVIASGKMEDPVFTSKMHDLLERKSLDSVTDVEFDREVLTIPPQRRISTYAASLAGCGGTSGASSLRVRERQKDDRSASHDICPSLAEHAGLVEECTESAGSAEQIWANVSTCMHLYIHIVNYY